MKKRILLNFAHPLPGWLEKHWRIISIPFQIPPEVMAGQNGSALTDFKAEVVLRAVKADKELEAAVNSGRFAVVPPQFPPATIAAVAVLHGLCGHFPPVLWQVKNAAGDFEPINAPVDIQAIRDQARSGRNFGAGVAALREVCPKCGATGPHDCPNNS
jgi:hypothetical protein